MGRPSRKRIAKELGVDLDELDGEPFATMTNVQQEVLKHEREDGTIDPDELVAVAKDESNPLHEYFTWDDTEAAQKQRRTEACRLIRSVRATVTREVEHVTAYFVSVKTEATPPQQRTYMSTKNVTYDDILPDEIKRILGNARRTLKLAKALDGSEVYTERLGVIVKICEEMLGFLAIRAVGEVVKEVGAGSSA